MILADTSIWVDYLRRGDPALAQLLDAGTVVSHPYVVGELMLGGVSPAVLELVSNIARSVVASDDEVLRLIAAERLAGRGIGWVDTSLLASTRLSPGTQLLTRDRRLAACAAFLDVSATI